ncbi:aminotransferase class I/II-fold pyridoxal phosphate-dependent enzyme [Eggerthellaceae bacterium zg-997]|nr:aminotransferase class I/II-fold pyridoxal phosphate-dependent enzyme [Eggerthellaceae bacterium zg-997]
MTPYALMDRSRLEAERNRLDQQYRQLKAQGLALNMARGKPSAEQLDLSMPLLSAPADDRAFIAEDGTDCRNYGGLDGLPEAKRLMACLLDDRPDNVIVGGSSSLTLMYDAFARYWTFGVQGDAPWCTLPVVKWICPVPGYDRHFGVLEAFGVEMIPVPMRDDGPDMDEVERIVAEDSLVKGIWCVPQYSNPTGAVYAPEVVDRLASMTCAATDFRIFWDNAYAVHHLSDQAAATIRVRDIHEACRQAGNPDRCLKFASTSKITFAGAGVAALAASPANLSEIRLRMSAGVIGYDKLNQLRHVRFLKDEEGIRRHMRAHAALLAPKFDLVQRKLEQGLSDIEACSWTTPQGGYFVSLDVPHGCAREAVRRAREVGVTLTSAGATWPQGRDPRDANIRIAPSMPPLSELEQALDVLVCCVRAAYVDQLLAKTNKDAQEDAREAPTAHA